MRNELSKTILYLENGVGFGGAVISLRTFLAYSDRERFRPVLVHSLNDRKFDSFKSEVKTIHLPKSSVGHGTGNQLTQRLNIDVFTYAVRLAQVARTEKVDCIYLNNDLVTNLPGMIAGRLLGIPVIQHERDIPMPISRLATLLSRGATRLLAISTPVRRALENMGLNSGRIRMVPEGLDLNLYRPVDEHEIVRVRHELGLESDDRAVIIVGMVMGWKGQHVLIDAAPLVLERHPRTKFLIVGEAPPGEEAYLRQLKDQVLRLGLDGTVVFTGYRGDIPATIQAADILIHASTSPEPFGRVVIEGMVMRKPVIATAIGAPPEIIRDGETGFLVPPGDVTALAGTINRLLVDPDHCIVVGEQAHKEVVQKYSIQRHAILIESVLEEVFWGAPPALASALRV